MGSYQTLNHDEIIKTIEQLSRRISERFPDAGLGKACLDLLNIAEHAKERIAFFSSPILPLRISSILLIIAIVATLVEIIILLNLSQDGFSLAEFIQSLEAGLSGVVIIGTGIFFVATMEARIKRSRALKAIDELRSIAHVIDMMQLTKDPDRIFGQRIQTPASPKVDLTPYQLSRYLDYCSEMLSLTGKVAALYVQTYYDSVALASANEVEILCTGLSRKIWQKLMIVHAIMNRENVLEIGQPSMR